MLVLSSLTVSQILNTVVIVWFGFKNRSKPNKSRGAFLKRFLFSSFQFSRVFSPYLPFRTWLFNGNVAKI